jgi:hypothetical protein
VREEVRRISNGIAQGDGIEVDEDHLLAREENVVGLQIPVNRRRRNFLQALNDGGSDGPDLRPRIGDLRTGQLIALRFASDAELPELTRAVLDRGITSPKEIKKMVTNWRGDYLRM